MRRITARKKYRGIAYKLRVCRHMGEQVGAVKVECCDGRGSIQQPAHVCALYGRCLPRYRPKDRTVWDARKPESDLYRLCEGCEGFAASKGTGRV